MTLRLRVNHQDIYHNFSNSAVRLSAAYLSSVVGGQRIPRSRVSGHSFRVARTFSRAYASIVLATMLGFWIISRKIEPSLSQSVLRESSRN